MITTLKGSNMNSWPCNTISPSLRGDPFHPTAITEATASLILGLAQRENIAYFDTLNDQVHPYNVISVAISFARAEPRPRNDGEILELVESHIIACIK